jgi:hypothetical protein
MNSLTSSNDIGRELTINERLKEFKEKRKSIKPIGKENQSSNRQSVVKTVKKGNEKANSNPIKTFSKAIQPMSSSTASTRPVLISKNIKTNESHSLSARAATSSGQAIKKSTVKSLESKKRISVCPKSTEESTQPTAEDSILDINYQDQMDSVDMDFLMGGDSDPEEDIPRKALRLGLGLE